jgi:hypothetical protein
MCRVDRALLPSQILQRGGRQRRRCHCPVPRRLSLHQRARHRHQRGAGMPVSSPYVPTVHSSPYVPTAQVLRDGSAERTPPRAGRVRQVPAERARLRRGPRPGLPEFPQGRRRRLHLRRAQPGRRLLRQGRARQPGHRGSGQVGWCWVSSVCPPVDSRCGRQPLRSLLDSPPL